MLNTKVLELCPLTFLVKVSPPQNLLPFRTFKIKNYFRTNFKPEFCLKISPMIFLNVRKLRILFFVYVIFDLFLSMKTGAQNLNTIDSLITIIQNSKDDSLRAQKSVELGKAYIQMDMAKAFDCFDKAIQIGKKNDLVNIIGDAYSNKGFASILTGEKSKAKSFLDTAMTYIDNTGNKVVLASIYQNYGNYYHTIGDEVESMKYHLLSLKIREELGDTLGQARLFNGIAGIYLAQKNNEKALEWYRKSLDIVHNSKDKTVVGIVLGNIGNVMLKMNKLDEAFSAYMELLVLSKSTQNKDGEVIANMGFSKIAYERGNFKDALIYLQSAETLSREIGNNSRLIVIYGKIGDIYVRNKEYKKALIYYERFYENAKKMGTKGTEANGLQLLAQCYSLMGDYENGYKFLSDYTELNDSLEKGEKQVQLAEMQTKFETEKKEQENKILSGQLNVQQLELSKKQNQMLGLVILLILFVVITRLIIRQNKLQHKQAAVTMKQKLLRSQMNPHFIFNSLTTIESFVYENQPKEAGKYLSDFARLMRLILENSAEEYIPLSKEINTLEYYLLLQKLRLENNLTYRIITDGIEDINNVHIPPMLTQPFIENAIEHGFRNSTKTGNIDIEFKNLDDAFLQIRVTDNGIGIGSEHGKKNESKAKHKSMAIDITKERLQVLNRSKKEKVTFVISDISDSGRNDSGTMVLFTIPLM